MTYAVEFHEDKFSNLIQYLEQERLELNNEDKNEHDGVSSPNHAVTTTGRKRTGILRFFLRLWDEHHLFAARRLDPVLQGEEREEEDAALSPHSMPLPVEKTLPFYYDSFWSFGTSDSPQVVARI